MEEWHNQFTGQGLSDEVASRLVLARTIEYHADAVMTAGDKIADSIDQAANHFCESYEKYQ